MISKSIDIGQGGSIVIDLFSIRKVKLNITSAWQDHCILKYERNMQHLFKISENSEKNRIEIMTDEVISSNEENQFEISLIIPEIFNISVNSNYLDLVFNNKIHGDIFVNSLSAMSSLKKR